MPALNSLPEIRQSLQSLLWRIAGDQPGIDSANGCPNDPVGLDAGLVQCLVDTDLIRAERAAPLQDEHDLRSHFAAELLHSRMRLLSRADVTLYHSNVHSHSRFTRSLSRSEMGRP